MASAVDTISSWILDEQRHVSAGLISRHFGVTPAETQSILTHLIEGPLATSLQWHYALTGAREAEQRGQPPSFVVTVVHQDQLESEHPHPSLLLSPTRTGVTAWFAGAKSKLAFLTSQSLFSVGPKPSGPSQSHSDSAAQTAGSTRNVAPYVSQDLVAGMMRQMRSLTVDQSTRGDSFRRSTASNIAMPTLDIAASRYKQAYVVESSVGTAATASSSKAATSAASTKLPKSDTSVTSFFTAKKGGSVSATTSLPSKPTGVAPAVAQPPATQPTANAVAVAPVHDQDIAMQGSAEPHSNAEPPADEDGDFAESEYSDEELAAVTVQADAAVAEGGQQPEKKQVSKRRRVEGAPSRRKSAAKGGAGAKYSEGIAVQDETGEIQIQDAEAAAAKAKESQVFDAFRTTVSAPKTKKKLVTKTYMDARGYLVTEDVWEDDPTGEVEAPAPVAHAAAPVPKAAPMKPAEKATTKKQPAASSGKQLGIGSFFGKK